MTGERFKTLKVFLQDVVYDFSFYLPVQMNNAVTELNHLARRGQKFICNYLLLRQDLECRSQKTPRLTA